MATSVGTLWVDVRFNTGTIARDLGTSLRGVGQGASTDLGAAGAAAGTSFTAGFAQKLTTMGTSLGNVGRQVSLGLSLPLIAFGAAATSAFTEFDTAMTQVISLSGVARDTVEGWRTEVVALGKAYGVSAAEAAEGMYFITSSGVKAAEAMDVLEIAVKGSAIGLGTVKTNADVITSAMNQYGESNVSAAQAADILTAAVRTGKGEADQMAGALARVIPLAGSMGVSFGEVSGVMSAMTLSGTSADEAATQINALLTTLQKMPPSAQRNMKALTGLDYATVQQNLSTKGLTATLRDIYGAFGDNEEVIGKVFGNVRALRGITNLFGEKEAQTLGVVNQTTNAFGDQDKAVRELEQSESFRLKQAQANLGAAMTSIGAAVTPIAAFATGAFGTILGGFEMLHPAAQTAAVSVAALAAASGPLIYMGASAMRLAGNIGSVVTKLGGLRAFDGLLLRMSYSTNALSSSIGNAAIGANNLGRYLKLAGIGAAAATAAFVLFNNALHDHDEVIKAIGEKGLKDLAGKNFDQLGQTVSNANEQIAALNAEKERLTNRPFGMTISGKELHELDLLQQQLYKVGAAAQQTRGNAEALTKQFNISTEAAIAWLSQQPDFESTTKAIEGYTKGVKENSAATNQAAIDTEKQKNSLAGIIAASKETSDAFFGVINAQKSYKAAQDAIVAAKQKVVDAEKAHTAAVKGVADAQRKVVDADRKVIESANKVADARQSAADAQNRLNEALNGPTEDEQLDLRSARLAVKEAQEGLRGAKGPLDRERAQIALRRAKLDLTRVEGEHERNIEEARKDLKTATDAVADAEQARLDAITAATDARTALQDARDKEHQSLLDIRTAQDNVAIAEADAVIAAMGLTAAQQELATMFATGTIEADKFRDYLTRLKDLYPGLAGALKLYTDEFERLGKLPEAQPPPVAPPKTLTDLIGGSIASREQRYPTYKATPKPVGEGVLIPGVPYYKRARGGPVSATQAYEVNERNTPEMLTSKGRQFLLPVDSGVVTPLKASESGSGPAVQIGDIHVHGADQPVQTAYEVRRQIRTKRDLVGRR